jgi:hypothetical protein
MVDRVLASSPRSDSLKGDLCETGGLNARGTGIRCVVWRCQGCLAAQDCPVGCAHAGRIDSAGRSGCVGRKTARPRILSMTVDFSS